MAAWMSDGDGAERVGNRPTMPILRLLPGLPSRVFFSCTTFFGGMFLFFFACAGEESEKCLWTGAGGRDERRERVRERERG